MFQEEKQVGAGVERSYPEYHGIVAEIGMRAGLELQARPVVIKTEELRSVRSFIRSC